MLRNTEGLFADEHHWRSKPLPGGHRLYPVGAPARSPTYTDSGNEWDGPAAGMSEHPHIAFVATECFPFVRVGGLADVMGSLPKALESLGARVEVVLPGFPWEGAFPRETLEPLGMDLWGEAAVAVYSTTLPGSRVRVFMIEDGKYFPRAGVYVDAATGQDYADQADRWVFFQRAALALIEREFPDIDVIHCHEHQAALIPLYLEDLCRPRGIFRNAASVLTIHNLGYQGIFPAAEFRRHGLPVGVAGPGGSLEFYGRVNFMKGGILTADALTVVSPTYSREIQTAEFGYGLDGVIAARRSDLFGILNGIDENEWNPATDSRILIPYSASSLSGKVVNQRLLLEAFHLSDSPGRGPVLAMVSRIDAHKGFDLVLAVLDDLLGNDIRFILVGTGNRAIEARFQESCGSRPDKAAVRFVFDDAVAHQVIAGADMFLMPSKYEPCGLTQMYALRYGTVPVVRATGGLADTVQEFDPGTGQGTGFLFAEYDPDDFRRAIERAIATWKGPQWPIVMTNGMAVDFSWTASAGRYMEVYGHAVRKRKD